MAVRDADLDDLQRLLRRLDKALPQTPAESDKARRVAMRSGAPAKRGRATALRTIALAGLMSLVVSSGIVALLFHDTRVRSLVTAQSPPPARPNRADAATAGGGPSLAFVGDTPALRAGSAPQLPAQPAAAKAAAVASARSQVTASTAAAPQATDPLLAAAAPELQPGAAPQAPLAELDAAQFLRRGLTMLNLGGISAAQLLLERAADLGSGEAAYALATTYDAAPGAPRHGLEVVPNANLSLRWYRRARDLGAAEASKRLAELKDDTSTASR